MLTHNVKVEILHTLLSMIDDPELDARDWLTGAMMDSETQWGQLEARLKPIPQKNRPEHLCDDLEAAQLSYILARTLLETLDEPGRPIESPKLRGTLNELEIDYFGDLQTPPTVRWDDNGGFPNFDP